jgi:hypothetical protein
MITRRQIMNFIFAMLGVFFTLLLGTLLFTLFWPA